MTNQFTKATKRQSRARVALDGPSGAGKTYTSLILASELAKREKSRIAFIDTENGSASLYSDEFDFDVLIMKSPYNPEAYYNAIHAAEQAGYKVIVIDSLSHAWEGEGGALEMVDKAATRIQGNSWAAWRDVTPEHRKMVDAILQSPAHIVATMRSKMEYIQEKDDRGKTVIRKVGMAPIQRQGMEYEFTIMADMDVDHHIAVSKSRCKFMADKVATKPDGKFWDDFIDWLYSGAEWIPESHNEIKQPIPQPANNEVKPAEPKRKSWKSDQVKTIVEKYDIHGQEVANMLNLSNKLEPSMDVQEILKWVETYRTARDGGMEPEKAAGYADIERYGKFDDQPEEAY